MLLRGTYHRELRRAPLAQRRDDFVGRPLARLHGAVQVALEIDRGVLSGEVAAAVLEPLGARELRVLADLPVGVRALGPGIAGPVVDGGAAVPASRDAGQNRLELAEELISAVGRG